MVLESIKAEFESPWAWVGLGGASFVTALALRELLPFGVGLRNGIGWTVNVTCLGGCAYGGGQSYVAAKRAHLVATGPQGPKPSSGAGGLSEPNPVPPVRAGEAGAVGIRNPGNGCYAITGMQVLSAMREHIQAVRPRDRQAKQLRRALLELFEERDRQIASNRPEALPWSYVQNVLDAVNVLRVRENGGYAIPNPFGYHHQECVWDLAENVLKFLKLIELPVDPFTRFKEPRAVDNPIPRYNFASYGGYFEPVATDTAYRRELRKCLKQIHTEHVSESGDVKTATLTQFINVTNLVADGMDLKAFAEAQEVSAEPEEWDVTHRLAFSFWYLKLWDPFPKRGEACDPIGNRNAAEWEFLTSYTLDPGRKDNQGANKKIDKEKWLLKIEDYEQGSIERELVKPLDAIAGEQVKRKVALDNEYKGVAAARGPEKERLRAAWIRHRQDIEYATEHLATLKAVVIRAAIEMAGDEEFKRFIENPNVRMSEDPSTWHISEQVAFALWRLKKFTPAPSTILNPLGALGDTMGRASVVRLQPYNRNQQLNSVQQMIERSTNFRGDLQFSDSMGVKPPSFLPFYFSRFDDQGNKHPYRLLPEERITVRVNGQAYRYELVRIAEQRGARGGGHYVSYGKVDDGWVEMNDSVVRPMSLEAMWHKTEKDAYGLLYRQIPKG